MNYLGHLCARNKTISRPRPDRFGTARARNVRALRGGAGTLLVATPRHAPPGPPGGMEALAAELGALTAERAAAPVSAVEVRAGGGGKPRVEGRGVAILLRQ